MGHNIEQGAGGLTFVEIQRFCLPNINFRSLVLLSNLAEKGGKLIW
jgi:hypothetical protein